MFIYRLCTMQSSSVIVDRAKASLFHFAIWKFFNHCGGKGCSLRFKSRGTRHYSKLNSNEIIKHFLSKGLLFDKMMQCWTLFGNPQSQFELLDQFSQSRMDANYFKLSNDPHSVIGCKFSTLAQQTFRPSVESRRSYFLGTMASVWSPLYTGRKNWKELLSNWKEETIACLRPIHFKKYNG